MSGFKVGDTIEVVEKVGPQWPEVGELGEIIGSANWAGAGTGWWNIIFRNSNWSLDYFEGQIQHYQPNPWLNQYELN